MSRSSTVSETGGQREACVKRYTDQVKGKEETQDLHHLRGQFLISPDV